MTLTALDAPVLRRDELSGLPIAVLGAGPVGLAAVARLLERGLDVVVLESGESVGTSIRRWGHVRLFSPWRELVDDAARRLLDADGWTPPPADAIPTGRELVAEYLEPLAATPAIAATLRFDATVRAVTRRGMDRTRSSGRDGRPFELVLDDGELVAARAVVDCTGTFGSPNPLASNGLAGAAVPGVLGPLPDVRGEPGRFAGRHTVVVGAGHSAVTTLLDLATLADADPGMRVTWAIRTDRAARVTASDDDGLPARASMGARVAALVEAGRIELVDRFEIAAAEPSAAEPSGPGVRLRGIRAGEPFALDADLVVTATGFRPDLAMLREVRLCLDDIVEAPLALAPLIDPNLHSCGTVPPHGVAELAHPEPGFFLAGAKSYGRAPTFLLATGYEQVRSIAAELAGDRDSARRVELVLPATGVCSTDAAGADAAGGCCS